jgi:hypothetical protein
MIGAFFSAYWIIWLIGAIVWMVLSLIPGGPSGIVRCVVLLIGIIVCAIGTVHLRTAGDLEHHFIFPWWSAFIYLFIIVVCMGCDVGVSYALEEGENGLLYIVSVVKGLFIYAIASFATIIFFFDVTWSMTFKQAVESSSSAAIVSLFNYSSILSIISSTH